MLIETKILYISANGDRWLLLCRNPGTERVFVRHEANTPSGGQVSDMEVGEFLSRGAVNPEHQALLRLIGASVSGEIKSA